MEREKELVILTLSYRISFIEICYLLNFLHVRKDFLTRTDNIPYMYGKFSVRVKNSIYSIEMEW